MYYLYEFRNKLIVLGYQGGFMSTVGLCGNDCAIYAFAQLLPHNFFLLTFLTSDRGARTRFTNMLLYEE